MDTHRLFEEGLKPPGKQRHATKRIFERPRNEYGLDGGYAIVKDYVREHRCRTREMFVPRFHPPSQAPWYLRGALVGIGQLLVTFAHSARLCADRFSVLPKSPYALFSAPAHDYV